MMKRHSPPGLPCTEVLSSCRSVFRLQFHDAVDNVIRPHVGLLLEVQNMSKCETNWMQQVIY
jgi:hypothetical protein